MNRRLAALVSAATVVGGLVTVAVPQHAGSASALAGATVVVLLAVGALVLVGPLVQQDPPVTELDVAAAPGASPLEPPALRDARRDLAAPASGAVPLPVWERLSVAAVLRLQRRGVDVDSPRSREQGRALLSPATRSLLTTRPAPGGTSRPAAVAAVVHRALDELDHLAPAAHGPTGGPHGHR